mgnify:CR=1 FL=1
MVVLDNSPDALQNPAPAGKRKVLFVGDVFEAIGDAFEAVADVVVETVSFIADVDDAVVTFIACDLIGNLVGLISDAVEDCICGLGTSR